MITENDFKQAATTLGCEINVIKAVYNVETAGRGYLPDGRVKILFEGHRFWKRLHKKAGISELVLAQKANVYPDVLYKKWTRKKYIGGKGEWDRMSRAIQLCKELNVDPVYALDSASYGSFQIMGENAELCGYHNSHEMLSWYNNGGEAEQLKSFCEFVINKNLVRYLIIKNFDKFAEGYNGTGYRENRYHIKIADEYQTLKAAA